MYKRQVIAFISSARSARHKLRIPLLLHVSAFFQKYLDASCLGKFFHLVFHSDCIVSFIAVFTDPHGTRVVALMFSLFAPSLACVSARLFSC